jgi:hypothetical protein
MAIQTFTQPNESYLKEALCESTVTKFEVIVVQETSLIWKLDGIHHECLKTKIVENLHLD